VQTKIVVISPTMAFVAPTKRGTFEIRESLSTPKGPRSRTLATFTELSDEVVEKARTRAAKPPSAAELQKSALRAGARVLGAPVDEAARKTLRLLANGARLDPMLRRLLIDALEGGGQEKQRGGETEAPVSDAARSATEWIGAEPTERGRTLIDLLELADALPVRFRSPDIGFPRLESG
jgi:hypothetical protein